MENGNHLFITLGSFNSRPGILVMKEIQLFKALV